MIGYRGHQTFVDGDTGEEFLWERCHVGGCPNMICRNRSDRFCYPHSGADKTLDEIIRDAAEPAPLEEVDEAQPDA